MVTPGNSITLEDGQEYLCIDYAELDGKQYLFLATTTEPIELRFAEQSVIDGAEQIRIVGDHDEKLKLLANFQAKFASAPHEA